MQAIGNLDKRRFRWWSAPVAALCFGAVTLSSCNFLKESLGLVVKEPTARVEQVKLLGISRERISLELTLSIENPNSFALHLSELSYKLLLEDLKAAHGEFTQKIEVAPETLKAIKIPLSIHAQRVLDALRRAMTSRKTPRLRWVAQGLIHTRLGRLPLTVDKEIDLSI